jgi:hypothetical protein
MTDLIASLSTGKGTWTDVQKIIESEEWGNIFLITNEFGIKNFQSKKNVNFVVINSNKPSQIIVQDITKQLKDKINGLEVGLNITSGTGKEHMAVMASLLKLGLAVRYVVYEDNQMKVL